MTSSQTTNGVGPASESDGQSVPNKNPNGVVSVKDYCKGQELTAQGSDVERQQDETVDKVRSWRHVRSAILLVCSLPCREEVVCA